MYDYEEGMTQCQNEIRRLRSVVRQDEEEIKKLEILLYNAVTYINKTVGDSEHKSADEKREWYKEIFGITDEELLKIGIDLFENQ